MFLQRGSRAIRAVHRQWVVSGGNVTKAALAASAGGPSRWFHETRRQQTVKPVLLADIGEGKASHKKSPSRNVKGKHRH